MICTTNKTQLIFVKLGAERQWKILLNLSGKMI